MNQASLNSAVAGFPLEEVFEGDGQEFSVLGMNESGKRLLLELKAGISKEAAELVIDLKKPTRFVDGAHTDRCIFENLTKVFVLLGRR